MAQCADPSPHAPAPPPAVSRTSAACSRPRSPSRSPSSLPRAAPRASLRASSAVSCAAVAACNPASATAPTAAIILCVSAKRPAVVTRRHRDAPGPARQAQLHTTTDCHRDPGRGRGSPSVTSSVPESPIATTRPTMARRPVDFCALAAYLDCGSDSCTSLGEACTRTDAADRKRRETPTVGTGEVGTRLLPKRLGHRPHVACCQSSTREARAPVCVCVLGGFSPRRGVLFRVRRRGRMVCVNTGFSRGSRAPRLLNPVRLRC